MTRILISVTLTLIALTVFGQRQKNEPISVVILKPREIKYDSRHQKYIDQRSSEIEYEINNPIRSIEYPPGAKEPKIERASKVFKTKVNYFTYAALVADDYLNMVCMGLEKSCPIIIKEFEGDARNLNLQDIAEKYSKQYVLDLGKIEIIESNGKFNAKISARFYNKITNRFLIDSVFAGEENENLNLNLEGLPLDCKTPMDCAYFNALSKVISGIVCSLNCGWIAEENSLDKKRESFLINNYFFKKFDKNTLREILPVSDTSINIDIAFQALFNNDSTKFVAFFQEKVPDSAITGIDAIMLKDMKEKLVTHSYIIYGVKYIRNWFYSGYFYGRTFSPETFEERKKSLFNELQTYKFGFFKDGTTEPDPAFWNTKLFAIVGDHQERNKSNFLTKVDDINYEPYKGLHLIVAKKLRESKQIEETATKKKLVDQYINPVVVKLNLNPQSEGRGLIYPTGMKTILVPIVENRPNNQVSTRYFVLLADEKGDFKVYEWTYFDPTRVGKYIWGGYYDEDLKKLSTWEPGLDYLNDEKFWSQYVLAKKNGEYKYLKQVE